MTFSEGLTLACAFASAVSAVFSAIMAYNSFCSSKKTIEQNSILIENATRPYISIYGQTINCNGDQHFYLVVKNSGASPATITNFSYSPDLSQSLETKDSDRNFLDDLSKCTIPPGQSRICKLIYKKVPEEVVFDVTYRSSAKTYSEKDIINLRAGTSMLTAKCGKSSNKKKAISSNIHVISYTLQEMLQKKL
ncbi:hypothetical protein LKD42_12395 [Lachnospiraceae bacterium CLA-AA-H246]|uniref:Uncharacterized protein n=1 Tax=Hominisplanchenecus faecis TaxID=2885351 RepID=A0ABS8EZ61_9FIRM|nr:hypothetical protein [Hominisplanchenecus faecis]MCC2150029.1 hypothetical protein [Hominisplanchenecus faecis]